MFVLIELCNALFVILALFFVLRHLLQDRARARVGTRLTDPLAGIEAGEELRSKPTNHCIGHLSELTVSIGEWPPLQT